MYVCGTAHSALLLLYKRTYLYVYTSGDRARGKLGCLRACINKLQSIVTFIKEHIGCFDGTRERGGRGVSMNDWQ